MEKARSKSVAENSLREGFLNARFLSGGLAFLREEGKTSIMSYPERRKYDWTAYQAMKRAGTSPQDAIRQAVKEGYARIEVWLMLGEVYGVDRAMQKAAWLDVEGIKILPEYRQRLDEVERQISEDAQCRKEAGESHEASE
jgi:hypothetical protein